VQLYSLEKHKRFSIEKQIIIIGALF